MPARILIVGAGAVGQVFAHAFHQAGAEVSFLVKPRHLEAARRGFVLQPLHRPRRPVRLDLPVMTTLRGSFDHVVLAVSADALTGSWLDALARAGRLVFVQNPPSPRPDAITGMVGFFAYASEGAAGTTWWQPPLLRTELSGPGAEDLVQLTRAGGLRARVAANLDGAVVGQALLDTHMAALECAGWSLRALRRDGELLALTTRAAREAAGVAARRARVKPPLLGLVCPPVVRVASRLAPRLVPFELEPFLRAHYTKVGAQTRFLLGDLASEAPALAQLLARMPHAAA